MFKKHSLFIVGFILTLILAAPLAVSAATESTAAENVTIPDGATPEQIKDIMAGLTDEQVRSILLEELKKEAKPVDTKPRPKGIAGLVKEMRSSADFIRDRFEYLFSGAASAPRELPSALKNVLGGGQQMSAGRLLLALTVLTLLWLGAMYLFKRKTTEARKSVSKMPADAAWFTKMGRLFLRALLDLFGVVLIAAIVFACYLTLFNEGAAGKPVIIAWLASMIFLSLVKVGARFLLAPHAPALRYLPLDDPIAQYLFRWTVWIARIIATGLLITILMRLEGGSEAMFLLVATFFGSLVAFVLVLIALWNKKRVAEYIIENNDEDSLLYNFAGAWHIGAIAYVLGFWIFWVLALMVFGTEAMLPGIMTLLIVPLYFLLDWSTQRLVAFAVELAEANTPGAEAPEVVEKAEEEASTEEAPKEGEEPQEAEAVEEPSINKFQNFLSKGFRVLVLIGMVFLLMRLWGIDFTVGRATVRAAFNTLVTLVLAYIFWIFISSLIERKLKEKQGTDDQSDGGEGGGGPGGDRFSTLLQLVKKFIFAGVTVVTVLIVLSSLGVDIGPLIAGASVFGIAIGFGAQTLVKDIISGIFFLMDDAFRVGDYIIVGSARGLVEEISVRSFKLRHHLGPLYTIPFGSIKEIQNMSRDWAIMKLQYLVPFDTDIQKVKKIIKKINKEIRAIPELNEFMLDDIKSQGVKAMEEYGMRMRVKFMTKPGGQFTLRKLVLAKMRKEFEEAGIEFAKPRVSVHMPGDSGLTPEEEAKVSAAASKAVEKKDTKPAK